MLIDDLKKLTGGCILREEHPLDYKYKIITSLNNNDKNEFPTNFRLWTSGIKNQQTKNTCVAHALATLKETQEYYDTNDKKTFSTSWIYGNRTSEQYQGEGMYIEEALNNLKKYGAVHESELPDNVDYDDSVNLIKDRKIELLKKAESHKINNYAITSSSYDIKSALYNDKSPVVIGIVVYESFYNINNTGIAPVPNVRKEKEYGGHAVVIIGWTVIDKKEYWVVQNSWGENWGDNGIFYIGINDDFPIYEQWCSVDCINNDIQFTDVDTWAKTDINRCVRAGLVNGYGDGLFKPENYITRQELCTIISRLLDKI